MTDKEAIEAVRAGLRCKTDATLFGFEPPTCCPKCGSEFIHAVEVFHGKPPERSIRCTCGWRWKP